MTPLDDRAGRWLVGVALLVGVWIVVYWMWEPGGSDRDADFGPGGVPVVERVDGGSDALGLESGGEAAVGVPLEVPGVGEGGAGGAGLVVEAPRFREYTVRDGETMERIARREYGSTGYWRAISRANPLLDPNRLRPGRVIRLPVDPGNIQGRLVAADGDGDAGGAAGGGGDGVGGADDAAAVIEYRIERNDTLGEIARRFYGSARWTDFLFQANRDRLRSPGSIRVGQTIVIPPKPAGDGP